MIDANKYHIFDLFNFNEQTLKFILAIFFLTDANNYYIFGLFKFNEQINNIKTFIKYHTLKF